MLGERSQFITKLHSTFQTEERLFFVMEVSLRLVLILPDDVGSTCLVETCCTTLSRRDGLVWTEQSSTAQRLYWLYSFSTARLYVDETLM